MVTRHDAGHDGAGEDHARPEAVTLNVKVDELESRAGNAQQTVRVEPRASGRASHRRTPEFGMTIQELTPDVSGTAAASGGRGGAVVARPAAVRRGRAGGHAARAT